MDSPQPRQIYEIRAPKQLLVEGESTRRVLGALARKMGLADIQFYDFGGVKEFRDRVKGIAAGPRFRSMVTTLGVVRDAERNASVAFQSIQGALKAAGLPVPTAPLEFAAGRPRVSVLILPHGASAGMLETVCLKSVADDAAMLCVNEYFECLRKRPTQMPNNMDKAKAQAYLASRVRPGLRLGEAADCGYWNWDSPAFDSVKTFLSQL